MDLETLFASARGGCQSPDCDHKHHSNDPMFLHPRCHPKAGTWVSVNAETRTIRVACAACRKLVVEVNCN